MTTREEWLEKKIEAGFIFRDGGVFEPDNIIKKTEQGYIGYTLQHRKGAGNTHWWKNSTLEDIIASREEVEI